LPKAAERSVFSYKLSILHFWSLVFMYIWAGPHHLHYTALRSGHQRGWDAFFSVMLWAPSWGGMINGLLTLRGAWHKVKSMINSQRVLRGRDHGVRHLIDL
jgi:cytochrome c oxidase cbb3-type subunit I/II